MKGFSNKRTSHIDTIADEEVEGLQYSRRGSRKPSYDGYLTPTKNADGEVEGETGELVSYAPDGGWGWVIVAASFLSNFVLDGISLTHGVMMEDIKIASKKGDNNELTTATYSLVGSVLLGVTLLVGPMVSFLTNKYGFRPVAVCGSLLASLGVILSWAVSPHVPNFNALIIFYGILTGIGFGMMFQISVVIVGLYFEKRRALATGIAICGTGVGTMVWAPAVEYITHNYGWDRTFIFEASVIFLSAAFGLLYRPLPTKTLWCKARWKALKDNYRKKQKAIIGKTGQARTRIESWPHFFSMQFLNDFLCEASTTGNMDSQGAMSLESVNNTLQSQLDSITEQETVEPTSNKNNKLDKNLEPSKTRKRHADRVDDEIVKFLNKPTKEDLQDGDHHFCMGIADQLRKMNKKQASMAKMKISKVMFDVEFSTDSD